jgi:hypothetical protein
VEHAQSMIKSEERKAAAQRARYKRRLETLEVESDRLRGSVMEAEAQVKAMAWANKKVWVRVWLMVRLRVRVKVCVRVWVRVRVRVHRSLFCFAAVFVRTGCLYQGKCGGRVSEMNDWHSFRNTAATFSLVDKTIPDENGKETIEGLMEHLTLP